MIGWPAFQKAWEAFVLNTSFWVGWTPRVMQTPGFSWPQSLDHDQVAGQRPQSGHVIYPGLASGSQGVTAGPREI